MKYIFSTLLVLCVSYHLAHCPLNASTNETDLSLLTYLQSMATSNNYSDVMHGKAELAIIGDQKAVSELSEMFFSESYETILMDHCEAGGKDHLWTKYGKKYAYKATLSELARRLADSDDERIISVLERYYYGDEQKFDPSNVTGTAVKRIMHKMIPFLPNVTEPPPIEVLTLDFKSNNSTGNAVVRYLGSRVVIEFVAKRISNRQLWIPIKHRFEGGGVGVTH